MNALVTWAPDVTSLLPTDTFTVLYKLVDPTNLNVWSVANPTALPSTATSYTITGLDPNSVYRIAVEKTCVSAPSAFVSEMLVTIINCPIYSYYQGPIVNGSPTLFYSISYPDSNHVVISGSQLYDVTLADYSFIAGCLTMVNPCVNASFPIGRGARLDAVCPQCAAPGQATAYACGTDYLFFNEPCNITSGVGYYGLAPSPFQGNTIPSPNCPGAAATPDQPILLDYGRDYRFALSQPLVAVNSNNPYTFPPNQPPTTTITNTGECFNNAVGQPSFTMNPIGTDPARLSGVFEYSTVSGRARQYIIDGTNQTTINGSINHYQFTYTVEDAFASTFPLLNPNSTPLTGSNVTYYRHAPIYIPITAAELSAGMSVICRVYAPAPGSVINTTVNVAGMSVAAFCTTIAGLLNAAGLPSDTVTYGGQRFIRFGLPDAVYIGAEIEIDGPNVIGGPVIYSDNVYGILNTYLNGVLWRSEDLLAPTLVGDTIGQYKFINSDTWQMIPYGGTINANLNDIIEFVMFDTAVVLYEVVNLSSLTTYDLANYSDRDILPTFNTKNSVRVFSIKCDNGPDFFSGSTVQFKFTNPISPNLPFTTTVTLNY